MHILTPRQETILKNERRVLGDLRQALARYEATPEDLNTLGASIQQLDELFLLVIVGEFNAGKSAFINALLGQKLLEEGVTPTTTQINLLQYGPQMEKTLSGGDIVTLRLPVDWLGEISIVDTPGTNAVIRAHEAITTNYVPRADLVLFVTSADHPFTESERAFLEKIRDWGKKVVLVLNKVDILQGQSELDRVRTFIEENTQTLLGFKPLIFPVSARLAQRARAGETDLLGVSGLPALEEYIHSALDSKSRLQLKFSNPLGVGERLLTRYSELFEARAGVLKADFDLLADVEAQLAIYHDDMQRDFKFRMADIENVLYEMEQRGDSFFDDTFRLIRFFDLLSKEGVQTEFERRVITDVPQQVEQKVNELIDWLVESDLQQWKAVTDHLAERRRAHQERIVGDNVGTFHFDRERVMDAVGGEAMRVVETYDRAAEAQAIATSAQDAVAASAVLEVGAIGLGALVAWLATTMIADVTGVVMATLVAALGLFIIPAKRRSAKNELHTKIADLRKQLVSALETQFEKEMARSLQRIQTAIAPYTRFVRAERTRIDAARSELDGLRRELAALKAAVDEI